MAQQYRGLWLPDREEYLKRDIDVSLPFGGSATIQFKKFHRVLPHLKQFRHAVDIGANCGIWTKTLARCFAKVTCFEPNPEVHEAFWLNNRETTALITLHCAALGNEKAELRLNTRLRSTGFTRADPAGDLVVEQARLDDFELQDVDFVKIDTEGWEHLVIKGGVETIRRERPVLIVEQKPDNAERHGLKQYGAINLLKKWGATVIDEISGDFIMAW
mgnify:CR=1 FL=1